MCQDGLIEHIFKALGLYNVMVTKNNIPLEVKPLVKDEDGPPTRGKFSYSSVRGVLLCLVGHTHPNISYAVNCCDQ